MTNNTVTHISLTVQGLGVCNYQLSGGIGKHSWRPNLIFSLTFWPKTHANNKQIKNKLP